jgi:hypothetical protein
MGNTSQSGTASSSKQVEVNPEQNNQIYEQILHLLSNVMK